MSVDAATGDDSGPAAAAALAYLTALSDKDRAGVERLLTDDAVHTTPFSNTGGLEPFLHFVGKRAVLGHADGIAQRYASMHLHDVVVTPAADPAVVFVDAVGSMVVKPDRAYENRYLYRFRVRDGAVAVIDEFANPVTFARVNDLPLG